ncbi:hypothetical protein AXK60_03025 [Tsukamurella pseudospumae]|uniref:Uncharacterized protein n=1 Tax=Tsukamurella pseudospumae TaxID=239498 RepID=A0A138AWM0_9ACTN|nr:hypothetical protein AXK60_03025 [Tsukamurella pseudospumae]
MVDGAWVVVVGTVEVAGVVVAGVVVVGATVVVGVAGAGAGDVVVVGAVGGVVGSAPATAGSSPIIDTSATGSTSARRIRFLVAFVIASSSFRSPMAMSFDTRKIGRRDGIR